MKKLFAFIGIVFLLMFTIIQYDKQNNLSPDNTITISHFNGISQVKKNPKKLVVLDYSALDNMLAMDISNVEIATSSKYIPRYIDTSKFNITDVGNLKEPDLEAIYNFKPDLIIINGRQLKYYDNLSKIAPTINTRAPNDLEYKESLFHSINLIGKLFEKEDVAMKLCLDIDYRVNRINSMKNINDKGMILFIVGNKMFVVGKNSMMGGLPYDYCKLNSIVTESTKKKTGPYSDEISFEYIKEKNPDYILVVNKDAALRLDSAKNKSFLMSNPLLQDVTAIKNNRVEFVNSEVWYLAGGGYTSSNIMMDEIMNILKE